METDNSSIVNQMFRFLFFFPELMMEGVKKEKKYQSDTDWALTWRPLTQVSLLNSLPLKCLRVA